MNLPSISVLVVAHNEDALIRKCLDSIFSQTVSPNEIVVVAHNCTDKTEEIVSGYEQVKLLSYQGPSGAIHARIKGFESVTGDIVLCIDGDAYADKKWIQKLSTPLLNQKNSGVGGEVIITNILTRRFFSTYINFHLAWLLGRVYKPSRNLAFWGTSFGLRREDYFQIGGLEPLLGLKEKLNLTDCPDDFYLAVKLSQIGNIVTVFGAPVRTISKEGNSWNAARHAQSQQKDGRKLWRHLAQKARIA